MAAHYRGRGVVSGDHERVWAQVKQPREPGVKLLQSRYLGLEVAVLPGRIRGLVVQEEEVVTAKVGL